MFVFTSAEARSGVKHCRAYAAFHQTPNVLSCPLISPSNVDQTDRSVCTGQRSALPVLCMLALLMEVCVCVCVCACVCVCE